MRNVFVTWFFAAIAAVMLAGCSTTPPPPVAPEYEIFCSQNVQLDPRHLGYDSAIGGYWVTGAGSTIRFERYAETPPTADLVLKVQTNARVSSIGDLRIVTPENAIFQTRFGDNSVTRTLVGDMAKVEVLRAANLITITRDGSRMRITFGADFLRQYAPHGMVVTWFEGK